MKSTILILLFGLIAFAVASQRMNSEFSHFLKGSERASDHDILTMYQNFLKDHRGSSFEANRDMDRFMIFRDEVRRIIAHNSNPDRTWEMGINHLSDQTGEEKMQHYHVMHAQECSATGASPRNVYEDPLPTHFDWRSQDMVSPVKDQKECGSCWTFSTTGAIESHYMIATGEQESFSEQQLIDCPDATKYDVHGCNGGLPSLAFNFIKDFGLETENDYSYQARDASCKYDQSKFRVVIDGAYEITEGDEDQLAHELLKNGPVSVAFEVVDDFMSYSSGVYSSKDCKNGRMNINHAVLAVGFGTTEQGVDYWIVKNSWSTKWGDEGYFLIERGVNMCGIAVCNSYPLNVRKA